LDVDQSGVRVLVGKDELLLLSNALNEVCNGGAIDDWEFSTRLGVERLEAQQLLHELGAVIDSLPAEES
jgi:hypothetical protein